MLVAGGDDYTLDMPQGGSIVEGYGTENGGHLRRWHGFFGNGVEGFDLVDAARIGREKEWGKVESAAPG